MRTPDVRDSPSLRLSELIDFGIYLVGAHSLIESLPEWFLSAFGVLAIAGFIWVFFFTDLAKPDKDDK